MLVGLNLWHSTVRNDLNSFYFFFFGKFNFFPRRKSAESGIMCCYSKDGACLQILIINVHF